jgi:hypothetical protein
MHNTQPHKDENQPLNDENLCQVIQKSLDAVQPLARGVPIYPVFQNG